MTDKKTIPVFVISTSAWVIWELLLRQNLISGKMGTLLKVLSILPFLYSSYKLIINNVTTESKYLRVVFPLFMLYQLVIVVRGWSFSYESIKYSIESGPILWPYLIPFFIFFRKKPETIGLLLKWIYFTGLAFILISIVFHSLLLIRTTSQILKELAVPCGFLLLNAGLVKDRKVNISFLVLFISLLSLIYLARRSAAASILGFIITGYVFSIFNRSKSLLFRSFPVIIICLIFFFLYSRNLTNEVTINMKLRFHEDTRSGLFEAFFLQMKDQMVFGKGMSGTYYYYMRGGLMSDGVTVFAPSEYRILIENGYLQLLLKGGIVEIVLFLLVLFPAALLGIFMSKNILSRACGVLVLLWLIDMTVYGVPTYSMHYILVWICAGICYTSSLRMKKDDEIRFEFKKLNL